MAHMADMADMAEQTSQKRGQPPLMDRILQTGKAAFDPTISQERRREKQNEFLQLIESTSTLSLLPVLNLLVQPDRVHPWLRAPIISALARLPLRPRGVQHTIEFVLSVHPTTSGAKSEQRTGGGSAISHEALNSASRLLSSPPAGMDAEEWFQGIAQQLFSLLQGEGEPGMDNAAAFIIGFGILGRRQYGAPGMPGWKALIEPIFRHIDPSLAPHLTSDATSNEPVVVLGATKILSSSSDLATALWRLSTLLSSHPNPALTQRLLRPILLPLWALGYWPFGDGKTEVRYRGRARNLLKALIQLTASGASSNEPARPISMAIHEILDNLLFRGRSDPAKVQWEYAMDGDSDGIQIQEPSTRIDGNFNFQRIDSAVAAFVALLGSVPGLDLEISTLFMELFRKWTSQSMTDTPQVITRILPQETERDFQRRLIEAKAIQNLIDSFPDKLVANSTQVLEVVCQVLSQFTSEMSNEDTTSIALSLLNIVLTSPNFKLLPNIEQTLKSIQFSLEAISRTQLEVSVTAKNLLMLLRFRSIQEPESTTPTSVTDQQAENRKTYNLAVSYLTTTDSPPPVRVQGLELISGLVKMNSSILDIPSLLVLLSSLLQDSEEYVYLRTIKSFIQLSEKHPKTVLKDLIDRYVDPQEESELDQRLRFGEALLQVIQSRYLAFAEDTARTVCDGLLFITSRRGYRPKTEQSQERKRKVKQKQDEEAEEAWSGEVPQLDEILEMPTEEDKDLMAQIVGGWESKRGSEDLRVRASALSILAGAIEANVAGIASNALSMTIDLCIHILTLEPELEKGILRRSAILTILSFMRALDTASQEGKKLGFGFAGQSLDDIKRILGYVEGSDNDGLVRQYAKDAIESLEAWQMRMFTPPAIKQQTEIEELAGLAIHPLRSKEEGRMRPRIEEIE